MEDQIIAYYCMADDLAKSLHIIDDIQCHMNTAEIALVGLVAARFFGGNIGNACAILKEQNYIKRMLCKSRICRRLHKLPEDYLDLLMCSIGRAKYREASDKDFLIDSFPIAVCHNRRIKRCRIYQEKCFHGYCASKKQYFYGLKAHCVTTKEGNTVEVIFTPGSEHDGRSFKRFNLNLPEESCLYADSAYNDYEEEDFLREVSDIELMVDRKSNLHRKNTGAQDYLIQITRKKIETAFSNITSLFPKSIHAVIAKGFELKACFFIAAAQLSAICCW